MLDANPKCEILPELLSTQAPASVTLEFRKSLIVLSGPCFPHNHLLQVDNKTTTFESNELQWQDIFEKVEIECMPYEEAELE